MTSTELRQDLQHRIATGCRIAGFRGLCEDILGHISGRHGDGLLIRCRGPEERGLLFTVPDDIRATDYAGNLLDLDDGYAVPNEVHIHTEILSARRDVEVVLHAHPPAVVALDLAGLELAPVVGAYDIRAARMASEGIPIYPRSVLIKTPELGRELVDVMGDKSSCVLRGHGIVTTGTSVEEALGRALSIDTLARMTLRAASAGGSPRSMTDEDLEQLPDLGSAFHDQLIWRFHSASLAASGFAITPITTKSG